MLKRIRLVTNELHDGVALHDLGAKGSQKLKMN